MRIYRLENVGNHLHLLVKAPTREAFQSFLRTVSGLGARLISGAKKGTARGKFWDAPAYSRVVAWGRAFKALQAYFDKNKLEAIGFGGAQVTLHRGRYIVLYGDPELLKKLRPA